jgi:hypothetical protein
MRDTARCPYDPGGAGLLTCPAKRPELDAEPHLQCLGEALQHRDGRHGATRLEPRDRWLLQVGPLGQLGLCETEFLTAEPYGLSKFEAESGGLVGGSNSTSPHAITRTL